MEIKGIEFKFEVGEVVKHKTDYIDLIITSRGVIEDEHVNTEIIYFCTNVSSMGKITFMVKELELEAKIK